MLFSTNALSKFKLTIKRTFQWGCDKLRLSNVLKEQKGKNTDMLDPMCMQWLSTGSLAKLNCTDT
jgi:hypothetical protein